MSNYSVIFDLFGVVIDFDDALVNRRISHHCDNPKDALQRLKDVVSTPDLITGRIGLESLYLQIQKSLGLSICFEEFTNLWLEPYSFPMDGMSDILKKLSNKYQLILLSNVDGVYWETIESRHKELEIFDVRLLSFEMGVSKPDRAAFLNAVSVSDAELPDCFFVDDKKENIEVALSLGLKAHHFTGVPRLLTAFEEQSIEL
ncbi:MAG: HAD-IA family hydrolase [Gammaproteobacteria bacterium]